MRAVRAQCRVSLVVRAAEETPYQLCDTGHTRGTPECLRASPCPNAAMVSSGADIPLSKCAFPSTPKTYKMTGSPSVVPCGMVADHVVEEKWGRDWWGRGGGVGQHPPPPSYSCQPVNLIVTEDFSPEAHMIRGGGDGEGVQRVGNSRLRWLSAAKTLLIFTSPPQEALPNAFSICIWVGEGCLPRSARHSHAHGRIHTLAPFSTALGLSRIDDALRSRMDDAANAGDMEVRKWKSLRWLSLWPAISDKI